MFVAFISQSLHHNHLIAVAGAVVTELHEASDDEYALTAMLTLLLQVVELASSAGNYHVAIAMANGISMWQNMSGQSLSCLVDSKLARIYAKASELLSDSDLTHVNRAKAKAAFKKNGRFPWIRTFILDIAAAGPSAASDAIDIAKFAMTSGFLDTSFILSIAGCDPFARAQASISQRFALSSNVMRTSRLCC